MIQPSGESGNHRNTGIKIFITSVWSKRTEMRLAQNLLQTISLSALVYVVSVFIIVMKNVAGLHYTTDSPLQT